MENVLEIIKIGGPSLATAACFLWYMNKKDERTADHMKSQTEECHAQQDRGVKVADRMLEMIGKLEERIQKIADE